MNIRSTIRDNPKLEQAVATGTIEEPSVIFRTPDGNRDLLLTPKAYADPHLRKVVLPIKNLVEEAIKSAAPQWSGVVESVSVIIDLTVKAAVAIEKLPAFTFQPIDGTDQLSRVLQSTEADKKLTHQEQMERIFGNSPRPPEGLIRVIASFDDDRAQESLSTIELVVGKTPILGEIVQICDGLYRWLDAKSAPTKLAPMPSKPIAMEDLLARLQTP